MSNVFLNTGGNSSTSTSSSSSLLRIPGMASGLDTDSIVKSMVSSYQIKIDKANQDEQLLQWKQAAYRDIIKGVKGLQDYFDPLSSKYILGDNSMNINAATSDATSIVSATAGASAKAGTYSVYVTQLASQAEIDGSSLDSLVQVTDLSKWGGGTLQFTTGSGTSSIKLNNITGTSAIAPDSTSMAKLVSDINNQIAGNSSLNGKVSASYVCQKDANNNDVYNIKFTNLSSSNITLNKTGTSVSEVSNDVSINGGISSVSKLTSSGLGILANDSIITAKNLIDANNPKLTYGTNTLNLTGLTGLSGADLAAKINSDIAADPNFKDKISAEYIKDASGNDTIKFTNLTTTSATYSDSVSGSTSFNGGKMSFVLSSGSNNYNVSLSVNSDTTMKNLIDSVNSATNGAITMKIDDATGKISFQSKSSGSASSIGIVDTSTGSNNLSELGISLTSYTGTTTGGKNNSKLVDLGFTAGSMNFNVNNKSVSLTIDGTTTMGQLIAAVNGSGSDPAMSIDDATGKVLISSASNITINNTSSSNNIINLLGLKGLSKAGTDAIVSIKEPGQASATTTTQSSNNFTVNGVSYNLVGVSSNSTGDANITVASNSDNVAKNIKSFITDYNTIISTINTKLTEKKDTSYQPLTDAQKQSMSDSQITSWETKAKVGILHNDDYLSQLMTELRGVFSAGVYSSYDKTNASNGKVSLSFGQYGDNAIGIDTSSDVTDGGKLVIKNETKLEDAIKNNFDDFKKLFIGQSDKTLAANQTYSGSDKYMEDGLLTRVSTILKGYVASPGIGEDGTYSLSGTLNIFVNKQYDFSSTGSGGKNTLPDQVYNKTLNITKLKTQMSDAETRYYNKFTALETALSTLNSQQSQLNSMLGTS